MLFRSKILNQNFKKLILVCWSGVPYCVNKYGIIMLINVMKFDELTITMVFSNLLWLHTKNPDQKSIVVAFNNLGFNSFHHGLNILLQKMQHFVSHVFSFISHLGFLDKMHSWLMDLVVGRKLEMEKDVFFFFFVSRREEF